MEKEIVAVFLWLNEVGALLYEIVIDVLTCLTNCSIPDFVKLFDFLLQQCKSKAFDTDTHERNTLEQVKIILSLAVDAHHDFGGSHYSHWRKYKKTVSK